MEICPVRECEFNQPYEVCVEIAVSLGESIDLWQTNCLQGDSHYLNCAWRRDYATAELGLYDERRSK